jgi:hypothetical protein
MQGQACSCCACPTIPFCFAFWCRCKLGCAIVYFPFYCFTADSLPMRKINYPIICPCYCQNDSSLPFYCPCRNIFLLLHPKQNSLPCYCYLKHGHTSYCKQYSSFPFYYSFLFCKEYIFLLTKKQLSSLLLSF